jgi:hypothetical protein
MQQATFLDQAIPGYSFSAASYTLLKGRRWCELRDGSRGAVARTAAR